MKKYSVEDLVEELKTWKKKDNEMNNNEMYFLALKIVELTNRIQELENRSITIKKLESYQIMHDKIMSKVKIDE